MLTPSASLVARAQDSRGRGIQRSPYCGATWDLYRLSTLPISVEFITGSDDRIRELSAKLLRAENPSVIMAVAEQLKIAVDTYVREHTFHIPAIKEITSR